MLQLTNYAISLALIVPFVCAFGLFRAVFGYFNFGLGALYAICLYVPFVLFNFPSSSTAEAPVLLGLLVAVWGIHIVLFEPIRRRGFGQDRLLIMSLGVYLAFEQLLSLGFGDAIVFPNLAIGQQTLFGTTTITVVHSVVILGALFLLGLFLFIVKATETGQQLEAVSEGSELSRTVGLKVRVIEWMAFLACFSLILFGASLASFESGAFPTAGFNVVLISFAICLLGGSPFAWRFPVVAFGIVAVQQLAAIYLTSQWAPTVTYAFVLGALLITRGRAGRS